MSTTTETPVPVPDWVEETPANSYGLMAFENPDLSGTHIQEINLDRTEYLMLKRCLGISREHLGDAHISAWALERLSEDHWESNNTDPNYDLLETCREIFEADTGCNAPFENFFAQLVHRYGHRGVTPDEVEALLQEFREEFAAAVKDARRLAQRYPSLVQPEQKVKS